MIRNIVSVCLWEVTILIVLLFAGSQLLDIEQGSREHYTLIFNTFIMMQFCNTLNCRSIRPGHRWTEWNPFSGIHQNKIFLLLLSVCLLLQILFVEFGGTPLRVQSQEWWEWILAAGLGCSVIPAALLV